MGYIAQEQLKAGRLNNGRRSPSFRLTIISLPRTSRAPHLSLHTYPATGHPITSSTIGNLTRFQRHTYITSNRKPPTHPFTTDYQPPCVCRILTRRTRTISPLPSNKPLSSESANDEHLVLYNHSISHSCTLPTSRMAGTAFSALCVRRPRSRTM